MIENVIGKVIYEYCVTKICSVLECGPMVSLIYGFDIILYQNSI